MISNIADTDLFAPAMSAGAAEYATCISAEG